MKILNLIQCANLGGMEQASLRLMRGLKDDGQDIRLLSLNPIGQLAPLLNEAGIPHEGLPYLGKGGWRSYGALKRKLDEIQADALIMTGHHFLGTLALRDFCRGRRILAIHFHHAGVKPRWQWQLIYRVACRHFNAITFPCDFIRREAESLFPPVAQLAHTVSNPIAIPPLPTVHERQMARQTLGLPANRPVIGNAGWLIGRKRFDVFLRIAREVVQRDPTVLFVVAGGGPERAKLESLARDLGIAENVRWLGWQQNMTPFYQSLDVLLFNSDFDALGLTPLEAMSFGIPVVCSVLHGELGEVINSDRCGFIRASHDIEELATLVVRLLKRPAEAAEIGIAGRKRVDSIGKIEPIVEWHVRALSGSDRKVFSQGDGLHGRGTVPLVPAPVTATGPEPRFRPRGPATSAEINHPHIAVLFCRIGPYHFSRLRAAGKTLRISAIEFSDVDSTYAWDQVEGQDGFEREKLFRGVPVEALPASRIQDTVNQTLNRLRPSAVAIPGWHDLGSLAALIWCVEHSVPAILMSETTAWDYDRKPWREFVKGRVVRLCAAGLVGGRSHADYLAELGMARNRISLGYDTVDNNFFADATHEIKDQESRIRDEHGLPERYFLASARFVRKKNLALLIEAYARYRDRFLSNRASTPDAQSSPIPWSLILLGDGPLKPDLCRLIAELHLEPHVFSAGFKQYHELPVYYSLASAFIHASTTEQWGLVVNEAMASGLPVLVSNRCGCARDLVREGLNGFTFDPFDLEQLAGLMFRLSQDPKLTDGSATSSSAVAGCDLGAMARVSREIIANWGPERFAAGMREAVELALRDQGRRGHTADRLLLQFILHGRRFVPHHQESPVFQAKRQVAI